MTIITNKLIQKTTEKVSNSFLDYFHLWTWLDNKITSRLSGRKAKTYYSVANFWNDVINQEIIEGDIIKFKEVYVTDWFPRQPGMSWLKSDDEGLFDELSSRRKGGSSYSVNGFNETSIAIDKEFHQGVVRLPFGEENTTFAALSFTSTDSWYVDLGVPLIVSKSVFNEFHRARRKNYAVEASFSATVNFKQNPLLKSEFISSLNSIVNKEFLERITQTTYLPNIFLKVISPIDITFRTHNTHPQGDLWVYSQFVKPSVGKGRILFFRSSCNLHDNEEINTICESFKKGYGEKTIFNDELSKQMGRTNPFADGHMEIHTEFDSRIRRFASSVPIIKEPWKQDDNKASILEITKQLENFWINSKPKN